ncbi:MAG TPA: DUF6311 domain-containing protein [Rhizomicrobium sp.]|nr:DUF6311 domain-containing protein [Rhizomicrobium sp.]
MTARKVETVLPSALWRRVAPALDLLCDTLAAERQKNFLLACSFAIACIFCLWVFDVDFLLGTSPFWKNPRGIVGQGWYDISTALSGYDYFQRDNWQLPLFHTGKLGAPAGTNIIYTDSIPWVALAGRLLFRTTGVPVNLYGFWTVFCFIASAITMTGLVASLGQRNIAAAAMASIAGLCFPALLARWGHMSLMAQFEIPLALIFYLQNRDCGKAWRFFGQGAALMLLALWTHTYLFAMVGAIVLVTLLQSLHNRASSMFSATALLAGLTVFLGAAIVLSGHMETRGKLSADGLGFYSMNLLSPFIPQHSGLYPSMRNVMIDGTGGQYEGFSYLGGGVMLLLILTLPWQWRTLKDGLRRNRWMLALFFGFTIFAVSNVVYLGPLRIFQLPLPASVAEFAAFFRSTGRFFWPVMYCLAALAIAAPISFYGRRAALLLCLAIPLQWIDSAPLRQALSASIRFPEKPHIDVDAWQKAIRRHNNIRVLPQFFCLAHNRGWNSETAVQLQLTAALADRPINTVYAARHAVDCRAERRMAEMQRPRTRQLSVFFDEFSGFSRMQVLAETGGSCQAGPGLVVCSNAPEEAQNLRALVRTDRK